MRREGLYASLLVRWRKERHEAQREAPEVLAIEPNQVWGWDTTKLRGPIKWSYFHLYVILDIFSRYVVGWMIAPRETAELAKQLIADTVEKQNVDAGTPTEAPACAPSPSQRYSSIWMSRNPTVARTSRMTILTPKRSSKHSNIDPIFPNASVLPRTPARIARNFSTGTTQFTATVASAI
jgi:hypothetical protein